MLAKTSLDFKIKSLGLKKIFYGRGFELQELKQKWYRPSDRGPQEDPLGKQF
jgi:hypothetical protein